MAMKKIVFSFILLFGAALFAPQSTLAQTRVISRKSKRSTSVTVKKPNRNRGVRNKTHFIRPHISRVVIKKPKRPQVIVKRPQRLRRNHFWVDGHWMWSEFYSEYIWIKGKWINQRRGHNWISGFWEIKSGGFIWVDGCWSP